VRVLVYSDLQAKEGGERLRADTSQSLQHWRVDRFFSEVDRIKQEQRCTAVWDLGDATDDRNNISLKTLSLMGSGHRRLCVGTQPVTNFKLIGNHEQYVKNAQVHAGNAFLPWFNIIDEMAVFDLGRVIVVAAAFPADPAVTFTWVEQTLARLATRGKKIILLGHFSLTGAKMASGDATGMAVGVAEMADLALFGHIHRPQTLGNHTHYVGSPFQQDFGEADEAKRVAVLDTDTLDLTWHALTGFPRYYNVTGEEFSKLGNLGEDRYRVTLRSPEEAAIFYAHPGSHDTETVYAYETQAKVAEKGETGSVVDTAWMMRQYVADRPLDGFTESEILAAGEAIMTGE